MRKHTIELDMAMVDEASIALGTKTVSETVHAALREVVDSRRQLRLLGLDPDLSLQRLAEDRRGRFDEGVDKAR